MNLVGDRLPVPAAAGCDVKAGFVRRDVEGNLPYEAQLLIR